MKSTDRTILMVLGVVGMIAAFWFLLLAPKREEASSLSEEVTTLEATVADAEAAAEAGTQAKADFSTNYRKLVSLGKAVPKDADTSSLVVQLQTLSERSKVDFRSITLDEAGAAAAAPAPAPAPPPETPAPEGESTEPATTTPAAATTPGAVPTESSAALLPIGAAVGPAGLPVMPYSLEFQGGFFQVADFFGHLDAMVHTNNSGVNVDGRLLTIDGFSLTAGANGLPSLTATVQTSSYLTPADEGITAGATPEGPATSETPASAATSETPAAPAVAAATPPPVGQ